MPKSEISLFSRILPRGSDFLGPELEMGLVHAQVGSSVMSYVVRTSENDLDALEFSYSMRSGHCVLVFNTYAWIVGRRRPFLVAEYDNSLTDDM